MIGDAVFYAASRATHTAVENVSRRLTWVAIAATLLVCALVLALIAVFMVLEPEVGALQAIGAIAAACLVTGLVRLSIPWMGEKLATRQRERSPGATAIAAINQEAKEAVDYFGAVQVVAAAFLFGLGTARRLRR